MLEELNLLNVLILVLLVGAFTKFVYLAIGAPVGVSKHNFKDDAKSYLQGKKMIFAAVGRWFIRLHDNWEQKHLERLTFDYELDLKKWRSEIEEIDSVSIRSLQDTKSRKELIANIETVLNKVNSKRKPNPYKMLVCELCLSTWIANLVWIALFLLHVVEPNAFYLKISVLLVIGSVMAARHIK
ncbi:MAG: hypothetical protein ACPGXZ_00830 [Saprospiraceae bacterium]